MLETSTALIGIPAGVQVKRYRANVPRADVDRFIGALSGQQLLRVAFNQPPPQPERRESLLTALDARVRDVRQGPDGYLYLAVERDQQGGPGSARLTPNGSILRIEPAGN